MNLYTNGFRISINEDRSEVVFSFLQNSPAFRPDDNTVYTKQECLSEFVMSEKSAKVFCENLCKVLGVYLGPESD